MIMMAKATQIHHPMKLVARILMMLIEIPVKRKTNPLIHLSLKAMLMRNGIRD
jgi:hypothetical protein